MHSAVLIFGLTALFSKLIALSAIEITLLRSVGDDGMQCVTNSVFIATILKVANALKAYDLSW